MLEEIMEKDVVMKNYIARPALDRKYDLNGYQAVEIVKLKPSRYSCTTCGSYK
jgi:hypothetical protein